MSTRKATKKTATKAVRKAPGPAPVKRAYAPRPYYRGYGDYVKAPKSIRPSKNTTKSLGGTIGAHLGHGLQTVIKALTGFGDYEVESNSLMAPTLGGDPPIVKNTVNNSHIVHHREYIGDVYASGAFQVTTYPINPGIIQTFPWLQQQADSYEQYKFRGLVFEFKSMSSDAVLSSSASSSLGTVVMSTQYNVYDTPFSDKRTMENYEYANSCKPSCSMLHPVECKMSQTSVSELYVRQGAVTQGDLRLYDLGNFSIAVQGMQNTQPNQVIGELWASFEIEFYKPKLLVGGGALLTDRYSIVSSVGQIATTAPFGTQGLAVKSSGSNAGTSIQVAAVSPYGANTILFPSSVVDGIYMIQYIVAGTVNSVGTPTYGLIGTYVNCDVTSSAVAIIGSGPTSYQFIPPASSTSSSFSLTQLVRITQITPGYAPGISFTISGGNFPTGTVTVTLLITQLSPSIN